METTEERRERYRLQDASDVVEGTRERLNERLEQLERYVMSDILLYTVQGFIDAVRVSKILNCQELNNACRRVEEVKRNRTKQTIEDRLEREALRDGEQ